MTRLFSGRTISDKRFQVDSLDGLRGLAALIVFLSHTSNHREYLLPHFNFTGIGKSGVWLFFVLSAFLLTYSFIEKPATAFRRSNLLNYALRRFLRIYPMYFFYLLLALGTSLVFYRLVTPPQEFGIPFYVTAADFAQQALFQKGFGVTWSILAEFRYYFVLPIIAWLFATLFKNKLLPSLLLTAALICVSEYLWPESRAENNDPSLGQYLPIFLLGSFLAVLHHQWHHRAWHDSRILRIGLEVLGFAAILVVILLMPSVKAFVTGQAIEPGELHTAYLLYAPLWGTLLFACLNGQGILRRYFEWPVLRYFGFISFSFYLLQEIFIENVPNIVGSLPFVAWLVLLTTTVASHITYAAIERPFSKIKYQSRDGDAVIQSQTSI